MNLIKDIVKAQKGSIHLWPLLQMVSCQTELRILTARIINKFKQDGKLGMAKVRLLHNSNAARSPGSCIRCKRHSREDRVVFIKNAEKGRPRHMPSSVTQTAQLKEDTFSRSLIFLRCSTLFPPTIVERNPNTCCHHLIELSQLDKISVFFFFPTRLL